MSDAKPANSAKQSGNATGLSAWALLKRYWVYARPYQLWIWLGVLMIPIESGLAVRLPLLRKEAVDDYIPAGDFAGLQILAIWFIVGEIVAFLAQAVQVYCLQFAGHSTITDLRRTIFRHVLRLPAKFYDRNPIGTLLSRTTSDVQALSETLSFGVFTIASDFVTICSILGMMFFLNVKLTLFSLSIAPLLVLLVRYFSKSLRTLQLEIRRAQSVQTGYLNEQIAGVSVVQLFGREKAAVDTYSGLGQRYLRATKLANIVDALLFSVMDGMSAFCVALLIYFAAPESVLGDISTTSDAITLGLLFAFVEYLQRVFVPIREFSNKLATIQRAAASLERIYNLLDEPAESRELGPKTLNSPPFGESACAQSDDSPNGLANWKGGLRIRDLRFRYREDADDVLKGISFDVEPGEVVAVVGRTGSGKTSLGRLLTRFYDGYRGSIEMVEGKEDTTELREVSPDILRRRLLMVTQDVFLFDDSAGYNVHLGDPDLIGNHERIRQALDVVHAEPFLTPRGGTDFQVGERGRNLSAGEAQLLAFARVAARDPAMLILDEATASVDTATEQKVQEAIEALFHGRSVLVIAHRLSTVRHADKILVMDQGEIAEVGSHDQLLAKQGIYAALYNSGFSEE